MGKPSNLAKPHPRFTTYVVDVDGQVYGPKGAALVQTESGLGYRKVSVSFESRVWNVRVHRLVLETFVGPRPEGWHVDHINANPLDNCLLNLRYLPCKENNQRRACVKFGPENLAEARRLYATGKYRQCDVGRMFGACQQTVSRALKENLG